MRTPQIYSQSNYEVAQRLRYERVLSNGSSRKLVGLTVVRSPACAEGIMRCKHRKSGGSLTGSPLRINVRRLEIIGLIGNVPGNHRVAAFRGHSSVDDRVPALAQPIDRATRHAERTSTCNV